MNLVFGILMLLTILIVIGGGLWLLFFSSQPQTAMEMIIGNKRGLIMNNTGLDPLAQPFKGWYFHPIIKYGKSMLVTGAEDELLYYISLQPTLILLCHQYHQSQRNLSNKPMNSILFFRENCENFNIINIKSNIAASSTHSPRNYFCPL